MSARIPFVKVEGTGNDFIVVDEVSGAVQLSMTRSEVCRMVCDRHFGIGADGLIFLKKSTEANVDIEWDFYNSDGSNAEMCGNAARAVSAYYFAQYKKEKLGLKTKSGLVSVRKLDNGTQVVEMAVPRKVDQRPEGTLISSGVPHLVIERDFFDETKDRAFCQNLRAKLNAEGVSCNITLLEKPVSANIRIVTFERGVEGFTLSCGTGALAAAYFVYLQVQSAQVSCELPGGTLNVEFDKDQKLARLSGPGRVVYRGEINL